MSSNGTTRTEAQRARRRERKKKQRARKRAAQNGGMARANRRRATRRAGRAPRGAGRGPRIPSASTAAAGDSLAGHGKYFRKGYGRDLGGILGEGVQGVMDAIGFGDYKVRRNTLMGHINTGTDPPTVRNNFRGEGTVIHHREFIGNLRSGPAGSGTVSAFDIQSYPINIGNSSLFPWGAGEAMNFQEWEASGILVELKTTSSNATLDLAMGAMFCAVDYNSLDPPPSSKRELENMEYAMSQKPSVSIIMPVECARQNTPLTHLYISRDLEYQGGDQRLYNLGTLFIGSEGIPALEAEIAEIWVTYDITLFKPILGDDFLVYSAIIDGSVNQNDQPWKNPVVRFDPHQLIVQPMLYSNAVEFTKYAWGKCWLAIFNCGSSVTGAAIATNMEVVLSTSCTFISAFQMAGGGPDTSPIAWAETTGTTSPTEMYNQIGFFAFRIPDDPDVQPPRFEVVDFNVPDSGGTVSLSNVIIVRIPDYEAEAMTSTLHAKLRARSANYMVKNGVSALKPQAVRPTKEFVGGNHPPALASRPNKSSGKTTRNKLSVVEDPPICKLHKKDKNKTSRVEELPAKSKKRKTPLKSGSGGREGIDDSSSSTSSEDGFVWVTMCPATGESYGEAVQITQCEFEELTLVGANYRRLRDSLLVPGLAETTTEEFKKQLAQMKIELADEYGWIFVSKLFGSAKY